MAQVSRGVAKVASKSEESKASAETAPRCPWRLSFGFALILGLTPSLAQDAPPQPAVVIDGGRATIAEDGRVTLTGDVRLRCAGIEARTARLSRAAKGRRIVFEAPVEVDHRGLRFEAREGILDEDRGLLRVQALRGRSGDVRLEAESGELVWEDGRATLRDVVLRFREHTLTAPQAILLRDQSIRIEGGVRITGPQLELEGAAATIRIDEDIHIHAGELRATLKRAR